MHCVYKITFVERLKRNDPPFYYIGSCANYRFENGILYNRNNNIYYGSSKYDNYKEICKVDNPTVEILFIDDDYRTVINKERQIQLDENAIKSEFYFNLKLANESYNYHELGCSIYKHKTTGKTIKLKTDDELVLNGTYIHHMKDTTMSEESKLTMSRGHANLKNNEIAYTNHLAKKSENMKKYWEENKDKRIEQMKKGYTEEVKNNISEKLKSYHSNLDEKGKEEISLKIKNMWENLSDKTKENRSSKISTSLKNSDKFKQYTDSQKEKRKGGNNPCATHVYWDGLVFDTLKDFNTYIKENNLNKSKCHKIIKEYPTDTRYILKRKDSL